MYLNDKVYFGLLSVLIVSTAPAAEQSVVELEEVTVTALSLKNL